MRDLTDPTDGTYFRINAARMSPGEIWNGTNRNPLAFLVLAPALYLGLVRLPNVFCRRDRIDEIDPADLPRTVRGPLDRVAADVERAGFARVLTALEPVFDPDHVVANALFLDADRRRCVLVIAARNPQPRTAAVVATRFRDDSIAAASDIRFGLRASPGNVRRDYPGVPFDELLDRHRGLVDGCEADGKVVEPYPAAPAGFRAALLAQEARWFDYHIGRGVCVPLSEEEIVERRARRAGSMP